jgi:hypothetical protein
MVARASDRLGWIHFVSGNFDEQPILGQRILGQRILGQRFYTAGECSGTFRRGMIASTIWKTDLCSIGNLSGPNKPERPPDTQEWPRPQ